MSEPDKKTVRIDLRDPTSRPPIETNELDCMTVGAFLGLDDRASLKFMTSDERKRFETARQMIIDTMQASPEDVPDPLRSLVQQFVFVGECIRRNLPLTALHAIGFDVSELLEAAAAAPVEEI